MEGQKALNALESICSTTVLLENDEQNNVYEGNLVADRLAETVTKHASYGH